MIERRLEAFHIDSGRPIDLRLTLGLLQRGHRDPTMRVSATEVWRATRTPDGPATTRITSTSLVGDLRIQAWGPGAEWVVGHFPDLVGANDDDSSFTPLDPVVADLRRRLPGLRLCRTGAVVEALVPAILEQKVIGSEAWRSFALLVRRLGEPAPGPPGLWLPPAPETLARTPSYVWHALGVERKRADTIRAAASYAHRLEEIVDLPLSEAYARLRALPGVGAWTAAEVASRALGDPDAVSVGDYHLPHHVAFALAGEVRADDARMLELLAPYAGQRGRVVRLIEAGATGSPRFGPRLAKHRIAAL